MYQYTTTNVINSANALDINGNNLLDSAGAVIPKYTGSTTSLSVVKVGTFLSDKIVSIAKRPYTAGVKERFTVTVPSVTSGLVLRLEVILQLDGTSTNADFANYALAFKKPIVVEILATASASADCTSLVAQINALKNRFGKSYVNAVVDSSTNIYLTVTEDSQHFQSVTLTKEVASPTSTTYPEYEWAATGSLLLAGKVGFGDNTWMNRVVQVPTVENTRFFSIGKEEKPIPNGNYTEYVLRYSIDKDGQEGVVAGAKSVTTHVFYVLSTLVTAFELALAATGVSIDTIGTTVTDITTATNLIDISDTVAAGATGVQIVYTSTTPASVSAPVFRLTGVNTSAGLDATKIALSYNGIFTMITGHGIAGGDTIGYSITIDGFTKTANLTFTA